ncbi:class I SAM-dependent methyltransferase [Rhizobium panacihumi]|uniref:class I SAM-dependent methyltransferase n=1 Tax=Rhizobium panacihumi TaxID=2008450 RepID=UPI003D7B890A
MSGFETRWLDLREEADHAARDARLLRQAIAHADAAGNDAMVVDLGCGTGSTVRAFFPASGRWRWRLLDNDPALLAEARERHMQLPSLECVQIDLAKLSPEDVSTAQLITASALFDLVSTAFLQGLVKSLVSPNAALYTALNYDGRCVWSDPHPADQVIVEAFNSHQRGEKGFGPALGPDACGVLCQLLETSGFRVEMADSPWRLGIEHAELQTRFITGMATAAAETRLLDQADIEDWRRQRIDLISTSGCEVGHWDMFARR